MATFTKFNCFVADAMNGVHNLGSHTLKIMLSNTAPNATDTVDGNITEITPQNGYSAGGTTMTVTSSAQSGGIYKLVGNDPVFSASGAGFGPARYAVLYNSSAGSAGNRPLIGYWDRGSSVSPSGSDTLTVDTDQTNGVFQLS